MSTKQRDTSDERLHSQSPGSGEAARGHDHEQGSAPSDRPTSAGRLSGPKQVPGEKNGPPGPEPTRYGDWEKGGRCSDF